MLLPLRGTSPACHPTAWIAPTATVVGDVEVGAEASIWFGALLRGDVEPIRVGAGTNIQDMAVVHVTSGGGRATIGSRVTVGHRAVVHGCTVHDDCLIGIGAIVLDGAEVGPESIVAAGAVVLPGTRVRPRALFGGVPAREIRELTEDDLAAIRSSSAGYVALREEYLATTR